MFKTHFHHSRSKKFDKFREIGYALMETGMLLSGVHNAQIYP